MTSDDVTARSMYFPMSMNGEWTAYVDDTLEEATYQEVIRKQVAVGMDQPLLSLGLLD